MKKTMLLLLVVLSILATTLPPTLADTSEWHYYEDVWNLDTVTITGTTTLNSPLIERYRGTPSQKAGEVETFNSTISYSGSVSGELQVSFQSITAKTGYTHTTTLSFSVSKASAPLDLGEYVVIYTRNSYIIHRAKQDLIRSGYMVDYDDNMNQIGYRYVSTNIDTAYYYVYEPTVPTVQIDYYSSSNSGARSTDVFIRSEVYVYENGAWHKQ